MNREIKTKTLAPRFESFHSKKVEDPNLLYSCFFTHKLAWLHMNSLLQYTKKMVLLEHTMKGFRGERCPWAAVGASLLPLLHLLQSLLQSLPSLASRVLACS